MSFTTRRSSDLEMPQGRKVVETYWTTESTFERVLTFMEKRILNGEQGYVVCPLIEESDKLDIQNAVDLYHKLAEFYSPKIKVGLIHGRLSAAEKDEIMEEYVKNELKLHDSTTDIQVGVKVLH